MQGRRCWSLWPFSHICCLLGCQSACAQGSSILSSRRGRGTSNYRGITVTPVLAKLFAVILEARLSKWAESTGIIANG